MIASGILVFPRVFILFRAFVAPADIQAFTSEAKNKLSARCQGKTKYFAQAVQEICEAFDELQKKKPSDLRDDSYRSDHGSEVLVDRLEDNEEEVDLKNREGTTGEASNQEIGDSGSKLERCSQIGVKGDLHDVKPSIASCEGNSLSPVLSSDKKSKAFTKKDVQLTSGPDNSSHLQGEDSCHGQKALSNGHKSKKLGTGSKRKSEGTVEAHKSRNLTLTSLEDDVAGSVDFPESGERLKDGMKGKNASICSRKKRSPDAPSPSEVSIGKKAKELIKVKKNCKVSGDISDSGIDLEEQAKEKHSGGTKRAQLGLGKPNLGLNAISHSAKKSKNADVRDDPSGQSLPKSVKGGSPSDLDNKVVSKLDSKRSSRVKTENNLTSRSQNVIVGANVSGDEAVLPLTKRRRRALEAMSDSTTLVSDSKMEKDSLEVKNDVSSSTNVRVGTAQSQKKRRAVCLHDDDDDEPKTPIHEGSAKMVKAPSNDSGDIRRADTNHEGFNKAHYIKDSTKSHMKESSSHLLNGSLSPGKPETDNKVIETKSLTDEKGPEVQPKPDESRTESQPHADEKRPETLVNVSPCPGKLESELLSSKEAKPILISPKKSPQLFSATKPGIENKTMKPSVKVSATVSQKKAQAGSSKASSSVSNNSQNQVAVQRNKPASSGERSKPTPKSISRTNDPAVLREKSMEPAERYAYLLLF